MNLYSLLRPGFCAAACLSAALAQEASVKFAPPTAADTANFQKYGRPLPVPEFLQPRLDRGFPHFQPKEGAALSGILTGAASDVLANMAQRWVVEFNKIYPHVVISVPPPYSGRVGAKELVSDKVDFALVSRELVPSDITDFKAKFGYNPCSVPIMGGSYRHFGFLDSVVFFVNKDNPLSHLSFQQLDALLSTTRYRGGQPIRTWGQLGLGGDWADKPIHVWGVKPWNGFEEFVRERVLSPDDRRGEWREDLNFVETVFPVAENVAKDRYAIGYAGLYYVKSPVTLLSLAVDEKGPLFAPSYEEVARARYPLSRLVYCNVNKAPGKALSPALAEFIRFILSREGQQVVVDQAIFLPLRTAQAEKSRQLLGD